MSNFGDCKRIDEIFGGIVNDLKYRFIDMRAQIITIIDMHLDFDSDTNFKAIDHCPGLNQ